MIIQPPCDCLSWGFLCYRMICISNTICRVLFPTGQTVYNIFFSVWIHTSLQPDKLLMIVSCLIESSSLNLCYSLPPSLCKLSKSDTLFSYRGITLASFCAPLPLPTTLQPYFATSDKMCVHTCAYISHFHQMLLPQKHYHRNRTWSQQLELACLFVFGLWAVRAKEE